LKSIDEILDFAKKNNVQIVSGFQLRHSGVSDLIKEICNKHLGGLPSMITVDGGANCIVTNGIHYLDLAYSIFDSFPVKVSSQLNKQNINPRGKHLGFWEGNSTWKFQNESILSINFSNKSSVSISCKIFSKNGYLTITDRGPHIEICTYLRDKKEIQNDPRIIRTGDADLINDLVKNKYELKNIVKDTLLNLISSDNKYNASIESSACKDIISSLIASETEKILTLPIEKNSSLYSKEWPIS
jgi:predicted dehydrogenase